MYSSLFFYICNKICNKICNNVYINKIYKLTETTFDSRNTTYICTDTNTFIKKSYKHEYETLIKLKHVDEVIDVIRLDVIRIDDEYIYYITMPYLETWKCLYLCNNDIKVFTRLFLKICYGLEKIHAAGVLHCDIKPDNIMVSPEEEIVFIDFEETGGTSGYIAPEIIHDKYDESIYTTMVDIWSLGMTMLNLYMDDYTNDIYECNNTNIEQYINKMMIHSSSTGADREIAGLLVKILRIVPAERIGLIHIIEELELIKSKMG